MPNASAEVLSTDRRVTCSIEGILAAALIAVSPQRSLGSDRSHRDEHRADSVTRLGKVAWVVQAGGADVPPAEFAEDAAGLAWVTSKRDDHTAAREYTADELAAAAAGGADHCGGHRVAELFAASCLGKYCTSPSGQRPAGVQMQERLPSASSTTQ